MNELNNKFITWIYYVNMLGKTHMMLFQTKVKLQLPQSAVYIIMSWWLNLETIWRGVNNNKIHEKEHKQCIFFLMNIKNSQAKLMISYPSYISCQQANDSTSLGHILRPLKIIIQPPGWFCWRDYKYYSNTKSKSRWLN